MEIIIIILIVAVLTTIIIIHSFSSNYKLNKAFYLIREKKYKKALDTLTILNRKRPKDTKILWGIAKVYFYMGEYEKSIKFLKKISLSEVEKSRYFSIREYYILLSENYENIEMYRESIKYLVYLRKNKYDLWEINYRIGKNFYKAKEYKNAVHYLNIANEQNPKAVPVLTLLGQIYYEIKNYTNASNYLKKALYYNKNTKLITPKIYLGLINYKTERYRETIKYLKDINIDLISDKDLKIDTLFYLGSAYFKVNNFQETYKIFQKASAYINKIHPQYKFFLYRMAISCEKIGKLNEAPELWEKLYNLDAEFLDTKKRYDLSNLYKRSEGLKIYLFSPVENFKIFVEIMLKNIGYSIENMEAISDNIIDISVYHKLERENTVEKYLIRFIRNLEIIDKKIIELFHNKMKSSKNLKGTIFTIDKCDCDENFANLFPIEIKGIKHILEMSEKAISEYKEKMLK